MTKNSWDFESPEGRSVFETGWWAVDWARLARRDSVGMPDEKARQVMVEDLARQVEGSEGLQGVITP